MKREIKVDLAIVNNEKMRALNREHRGQDKAVEVLAFPYNEELPDGIYFLGEIVVNRDQAKSKEEILELVKHGARNLLGDFKFEIPNHKSQTNSKH